MLCVHEGSQSVNRDHLRTCTDLKRNYDQTRSCHYRRNLLASLKIVSGSSFIDDKISQSGKRNISVLAKITAKQPIPFTDIVYNLTIKTGDKLNSGTDANVFFSLHGDKGETPRIGLQDESQTFRRFERSRADKFVVQTSDVGKVRQSLLCMCYAWMEKQEFTYPGCQSFGFFG